MRKTRGVVRGIYFPNDVDNLVEAARAKLGMSRSQFLRYAVVRLLQDLGVLSKALE